jgi:hypothetical protein
MSTGTATANRGALRRVTFSRCKLIIVVREQERRQEEGMLVDYQRAVQPCSTGSPEQTVRVDTVILSPIVKVLNMTKPETFPGLVKSLFLDEEV